MVGFTGSKDDIPSKRLKEVIVYIIMHSVWTARTADRRISTKHRFGSFVTFLFAFVLPETSPGGANGPHFREGH